MKNKFYSFLVLHLLIVNFNCVAQKKQLNNTIDSVLKIEMKLSAFGVESDDFPSIEGEINFRKQTSIFKKSYYNPTYKDSIYSLRKEEIKTLYDLLQKSDLTKLKKEYKLNLSDQPNSIIVIYTQNNRYEVYDYGLKRDDILIKIYNIAYKI